MKEHGVVLTQNYKPIKLIRCNTEKESERIYQKNKAKGYGVVKVKIEKAFELDIMRA